MGGIRRVEEMPFKAISYIYCDYYSQGLEPNKENQAKEKDQRWSMNLMMRGGELE